jgi:hypothetical protein
MDAYQEATMPKLVFLTGVAIVLIAAAFLATDAALWRPGPSEATSGLAELVTRRGGRATGGDEPRCTDRSSAFGSPSTPGGSLTTPSLDFHGTDRD